MNAAARPRVWTFQCAWDAMLALSFGSLLVGTFARGIPSLAQLAGGGIDVLGTLVALLFLAVTALMFWAVGRDVESNLRLRAEWDAANRVSS